MEDLVSVIVPVYNSSKYIQECLNSILKQSYTNLEIIVINDGSTDDSEKIILELKKDYEEKIYYIKQENSGAGFTRNKGISIAQGKYIIFVDSDDIIREDYIETLVNKIQNKNLDVVCSGQVALDKKNQKIVQQNEPLYKYTLLGVHGKIYNREYLINNNITFSQEAFAEDAYFNLQVILMTNKIEDISYVGYYYRKNEKGITRKHKKEQN